MTTTTFQVRVCDRCGAKTEPMTDEMPTTGDERIGWRFITHGCKGTVGSTVDLCSDCYREFESFMDGAKPLRKPREYVFDPITRKYVEGKGG